MPWVLAIITSIISFLITTLHSHQTPKQKKIVLLPPSRHLVRCDWIGSSHSKTIFSSSPSSSLLFLCPSKDGLAKRMSGSISESSWESIIPIIKEWIEQDPNEKTSSYVQNLLNRADHDAHEELSSLFPSHPNKRIEFGTAGLRSNMKPGPLHMNDLTVIQTAQGIAKYCYDQNKNNDSLQIVIGYDHRRSDDVYSVSSLSFAIWTTIVFQQCGYFTDVLLFDGYVATPLIPFTLQQMSSQDKKTIGIMITASHNPKQDAGYKVYWTNGCQIRSPIDIDIANSILQNLQLWYPYKDILYEKKKQYSNDPTYGLSNPQRTEEMIQKYYHTILSSKLITKQPTLSFINKQDTTNSKSPKICYTAMHGVGYRFVNHVIENIVPSSVSYVSVSDQQEPDPDFTTVSFPNPEEKGALDLAKQYATEHDCDIIMANDPDADRFALAEKDNENGKWFIFTGDQIGIMLGYWLWENIGKLDTSGKRKYAMCASTASSKMLQVIAQQEGFYFEDTLTGFKWIGSRAYELSNEENYEILFGYEEAIGFACGNIVYDKDGITALVVGIQLATYLYQNNYTLQSYLQALYDKYGEFVSNNGYYFIPNPAVTMQIFDEITNHGTFALLLSGTIGPYQIKSFRYLGEPGYDTTKDDNKPTLPTSKSSPMLTLYLTNNCCIQFRGSGTEPKFKYYIELQGQPGISRAVVTEELMTISQTVLDLLIQPTKWGLITPK